MLQTPSRLILLPLLLLALSCGRRTDDDTNTLHFINRGDIFTLDLNEMSYGQDIRVTYLMREGLYSPTGPQQTPVPAGATGCDVSADKLVYTFHLRPTAHWSNGDPVVAADYVFSWRHMLEQPGEYTYLFYYIKGAQAYMNAYADGKTPAFDGVGIRTIDPYTLEVTLNHPVTYFLDLAAFTPFYPRNQASMDAVGSDGKPKFRQVDPATGHVTYDSRYTRPPDIVCNGPFVLSEWEFKRVLRFTKNPRYWDADHVRLNEVDMVVNENTLSGYLQFAARAVDWICELPADISPELRAKNEPGLSASPAFGTAFLSLNCQPTLPNGTKNPMADPRVRQALAMAIDKAFITTQITRMGEAVATHYIPPGTLPGYTSLPGLDRDVPRAKRLLADAGFADGRGFPRLSILYNTENSTRARFVQALKQQWKQALGIDVEIEGLEGKIFKDRISHKNFDIGTVSWYGDYPDVSTFTDKYLSTSLQNETGWADPQYDALLGQAAAEGDPVRRFGQLQQAEQLINTQVPIIPLYHYVNVTLIGPRTRGIGVNPRNLVDWKNVTVGDVNRP